VDTTSHSTNRRENLLTFSEQVEYILTFKEPIVNAFSFFITGGNTLPQLQKMLEYILTFTEEG
jgi:hypothetical protein